MRMPRIMVETPGAPVVQHIQIVLAVSIAALAPCGFPASAALSPYEGQLLRTSLLTLCYTHYFSLRAALTPSCVGLGWSCSYGDVMPSRIRRGHHHLHSCEMSLFRVFFVASNTILLNSGELVCPCFRYIFNLRRFWSAPRHPPVDGASCSLRAVALLWICQHCCL